MRCPQCGHVMSEREIKHLWCTHCNAEFSDISELNMSETRTVSDNNKTKQKKKGNSEELHLRATTICFVMSILCLIGGLIDIEKPDEVIIGKGNPHFQGKISLVVGSIALVATLIWLCYQLYRYFLSKNDADAYEEMRRAEFQRTKEKEDHERSIIEGEKEYAELMQAEGAPWSRRYYTFPCPYCNHYKVRPANWDDKKVSVAFWGPYMSKKLTDRYKCENCNKMWD